MFITIINFRNFHYIRKIRTVLANWWVKEAFHFVVGITTSKLQSLSKILYIFLIYKIIFFFVKYSFILFSVFIELIIIFTVDKNNYVPKITNLNLEYFVFTNIVRLDVCIYRKKGYICNFSLECNAEKKSHATDNKNTQSNNNPLIF